MSETLLYLIRHGVTDWNYDGRAQGMADIPLNAEGVRQAQAAAERLASQHWDAIYSSTLTRAAQTAELIAGQVGLPVSFEPRLVERSMGPAEGSTPADRAARWPGISWRDLPDLEPDRAMVIRAQAALTEIAERHPGGRVIVVSHGAFIGFFLRSLVPPGATPFGSSPQRNTAITPVRYASGKFLQAGPPDHSHILMDGIEFSGEKGRLRGSELAALLGSRFPPLALEAVVFRASAVEAAWQGERLVGFARCFTDGCLHGYIDLTVTRPEFSHLTPTLLGRLAARYPNVSFTRLSTPAQERSGD